MKLPAAGFPERRSPGLLTRGGGRQEDNLPPIRPARSLSPAVGESERTVREFKKLTINPNQEEAII